MGCPGNLAGVEALPGERAEGPTEPSNEGDGAEHVPVLYQAVLDGLEVRPGGRYIDATVGGGGHSAGILASSAPTGHLLALDRDPAAVAAARRRLFSWGARVSLVHSSFARLAEVARAREFIPVDGILIDLGLSSLQLSDAARGFAFTLDGPLDMRFDPTQDTPSAAELVNDLSPDDLATLFFRYGEEKQARRIARAIVAERPLQTTGELAAVVERTVGRRGRIHPATRTFQALRIAVNDELGALEAALPQALEVLCAGGRLAVISFHSLEDRQVKQFMRRESRDCICPPEAPACVCDHRAKLRLVSRKPIRPTEEEIASNPRARSAKLRVAERLEDQDP